MDNAYAILLHASVAILGLLLFFGLYRSVKGPNTADRIIAVNMIGTVTILIIFLISLITGEGYLIDIALIYAMLSFLAVVLLCKIYIGICRARKEKEGKKNA